MNTYIIVVSNFNFNSFYGFLPFSLDFIKLLETGGTGIIAHSGRNKKGINR